MILCRKNTKNNNKERNAWRATIIFCFIYILFPKIQKFQLELLISVITVLIQNLGPVDKNYIANARDIKV